MLSGFAGDRVYSWDDIMMVRALLDHRELEVLYAAFDDEVNEDNPLHRWFDLTRGHRRPRGKEAAELDQGLIKNQGFEAGLEGWTTYGPPPQFGFDTDVKRAGHQALRVIAPQPSDTGCYQDVTLKPRHLYRCSGWVRTRGLNPRGARCWGTFSICHAGGNNRIAKGDNTGGNTDWTPVSIQFQAPDRGAIRIYAHLAGWGPATGTVWFDDLRLAEVNQPAR
jgi:hypothetical protein